MSIRDRTHGPLALRPFCVCAQPADWGDARYATFWQYADSGPNPGDQDEFNGSAQGLKKYVHVLFTEGLTRKADGAAR